MKSRPFTSSWMPNLKRPSEGKVNGTCPSITVTVELPMRTLLDAFTTAPAPRAVALVRLLVLTLAPTPKAVLNAPVLLLLSVKAPKAVLAEPVVLELMAKDPKAALLSPEVLPNIAETPTAVLFDALLFNSVNPPMATFWFPVVLSRNGEA